MVDQATLPFIFFARKFRKKKGYLQQSVVPSLVRKFLRSKSVAQGPSVGVYMLTGSLRVDRTMVRSESLTTEIWGIRGSIYDEEVCPHGAATIRTMRDSCRGRVHS